MTKIEEKTRSRIAPSPTGFLHVGTARAALFNYLFAKRTGGKFIVRIEDTDLERSDPKFEKDIFEGFEWLEIIPDESPLVGGPHEPYRDSERIQEHRTYIEQLLSEEKAFYCFHSEQELAEEKEKLLKEQKPLLHFCEFRSMSVSEARVLAETKADHIIRFKTPVERSITFNDLVRGEVTFQSDLIGDFSIARKVDSALYNFAVVIDDIEMKITHVIRGEDHIANTPKQILLFEALGASIPQFAHLPLLLGIDRSKLSKRHGATSVNEYKEAGYLPEALFNFLALLGWNPGGDEEILSREEIIDKFSLERVQKSGAIFDITKLDWMNGEYIRKKNPKELFDISFPFLKKYFDEQISKYPDEYIKKVLLLEQPRLKKLSELQDRVDYFFHIPDYDTTLLVWKNTSKEELVQSLEVSKKIITEIADVSKSTTEKVFLSYIGRGDKGKILWPLRVAVSGKKASPSPFEIMEILGKDESLNRLEIAFKKVHNTSL